MHLPHEWREGDRTEGVVEGASLRMTKSVKTRKKGPFHEKVPFIDDLFEHTQQSILHSVKSRLDLALVLGTAGGGVGTAAAVTACYGGNGL